MADAMDLDASDSNNTSSEVLLHPLVLMNMSDHATRMLIFGQSSASSSSSSAPPTPTRVIGIILGTQTGQVLELVNSFECVTATAEGEMVIDRDYLLRKSKSIKSVFKELEVVGWYATGTEVLPVDYEVHRMMLELFDTAVFVTLDTSITTGAKDMGIVVHESDVQIVDGHSKLTFHKAKFKVETQEAERIAVDHMAHVQTSGADGDTTSQLHGHLSNIQSALSMLCQRTGALSAYINDVSTGKIERDHVLIRQMSSLCNSLPAVTSPSFREEFQQETNHQLLIAQLAALTSGCATTNEVIEKYQATYQNDHPGVRGRRMHGKILG